MILIVFSDFFDMSDTTADGFYEQGVQILVNMCAGSPPKQTWAGTPFLFKRITAHPPART
jgi:hypothetical protein